MKPWGLSSSESFSMLIPGCTVTVRSSTSISRMRFMSLTSTMIPCRSGTAPSVRPVPPARGTTGTRSRLASFTTSEICSADVGRTTASGTKSSQRWTGKGEGTRARLKRAEAPAKTCSSPQIWTNSSRIAAESATVATSALQARRLGDELHQVDDLDVLLPTLLGERPLRPDAGRDERVDLERLGALDAAPADLRRQVGPLDPEPGARAGAVGPLGHVVDVLEGQAGDRPEDLSGRRVDSLSLVEPAGVVIRGDLLDRHRKPQLSVLQELRDELDHEDDLEVEPVAEVARVVLREGDVVVRVEHEDALRADCPPVGDVVLGEAARLVGVAHLGARPAAAPLLSHEPERDSGSLEDPCHRARDARAVEGRLAVAEEDGLSADGEVEALGPVGHVLLGDGRSVQHGLALRRLGELVPALPARLVDAALDGERPHRLDEVDRARPEAVEVAGEERVRAAQLACAALGAVDVVARDVLDREVALVHGDDVRVEGRGRVGFVPRDLHDRADLAAELVARAVAVVRRVPPLGDELVREGAARRRFSHGTPLPRSGGCRDSRALGYKCPGGTRGQETGHRT